MKKFEQPPQKSRIELAEDIIKKSPEAIEDEFQRTPNSWPSCFGSRIFVIETYLDSKKVEEEIGKEKFDLIINRIKDMKERLHELHQQYSDKNTVPTDDVKKELLNMLNVLK